MDTSEWAVNNTRLPKGTDVSYSDDAYVDEDEEDIDDSFPDTMDTTADITDGSAYEGDTSGEIGNTSIPIEWRRKRKQKKRIAPILRRTYYGKKRLMTGTRHFVSSVIEYSAGAAL